jgi:hypothetical protein
LRRKSVRKVLVLILVIVMAVTIIAVAGCDGDDTTTTVVTPGGEATLSDKPPGEAELGIPIYPDAQYVPESGSILKGSTEEGEFATASASFKTEDDFEEVVAWHIERLGEPSYLSREEPKEANWMHIAESGEVIVVSIDDDGDEVVISIGRMSG